MKNKGFTMVELLVTIVIIGIVSSIGVVSVINLRESQRQKFNQTQNEIFLQTAKTYFTDHKKKLPNEPMQTKKITLKELKDINYITSSFLDYDKKEFKDTSEAIVRKIGNNIYAYSATLITSNENKVTTANNKGNISYTIKNKKNNINKIGNNNYTNNTPNITIVMSDSDYIMAYKYKIYKNSKLFKESEYVYVNKQTKYEDILSLDLNEYGDGNYIIEFTMYDSLGMTTSAKSNKIIIDTKQPVCKLSSSGTVGENNWYISTTTIKMDYSDENSEGLKKGLSTKTSAVYNDKNKDTQSDTKKISWYGYIKDASGNTNTCSIEVKVDTKAPVISGESISSTNTNYHTLNANVSFAVKDVNYVKYELSTSGYTSTPYNAMPYSSNLSTNTPISNTQGLQVHNSYDGSTKNVYITVKDEAGNKSQKMVSYKVYKTCSQTIVNSSYAGNYGACSAICGGGIQYASLFQVHVDQNLGVNCGTTETQNALQYACNMHDCCSLVYYEDGDDCTAECGGGTYNRLAYSSYTNDRCPAYDQGSGGSSCNTESCCADAKWGDWSDPKAKTNSKGVITSCKKTRKKKVNGKVCQTQTKSLNIGKCIGKNKCNIRGNTKYSVSVHWPYNTSSTVMTCGKSHSTGYWHYCTDSDGKLYNRLGKTSSANTFQWICPDIGSNSTYTKDYYIIDDSGGKWSKYSDSCYASSC